MWKFLTNIIGGSIFDGVGGIIKSIWGDRSEKDKYSHLEQIEALRGYQAEFMAPEKKNIINIIVDAVNRLVRPTFTYGIIALFIWAFVDPAEFTIAMQAVQVIPEMLWWILFTIIGFWFGTRLLEKMPLSKIKITEEDVEMAKQLGKNIREQQAAVDREQTQTDYDNDFAAPPVSVPTARHQQNVPPKVIPARPVDNDQNDEHSTEEDSSVGAHVVHSQPPEKPKILDMPSGYTNPAYRRARKEYNQALEQWKKQQAERNG